VDWALLPLSTKRSLVIMFGSVIRVSRLLSDHHEPSLLSRVWSHRNTILLQPDCARPDELVQDFHYKVV